MHQVWNRLPRALLSAVEHPSSVFRGQQIVGDLLAYCFSLIGSNKAIKSWQAIFLAYGFISVLYGLVLLKTMPDSPMRAK
jgi:sugar phosphate permease